MRKLWHQFWLWVYEKRCKRDRHVFTFGRRVHRHRGVVGFDGKLRTCVLCGAQRLRVD